MIPIEDIILGGNDNIIVNGSERRLEMICNVMKNLPDRVVCVEALKKDANILYNLVKKLKLDVGIVTGDIQVGFDSKIVIVTMETYINALKGRTVDLSVSDRLVIFNNFQYFFDNYRGYLWEEAIISRGDKRLICFSSFIPNANRLKDWIAFATGRKTTLIEKIESITNYKHFILQLTTNEYENMRKEKPKLPYLCKNKKLVQINDISGKVDIEMLHKCLYSAINVDKHLLRGNGLINFTMNALTVYGMFPAAFLTLGIDKCERYAMSVSKKREKVVDNEILKLILSIMETFSDKTDPRFSGLVESELLDRLVYCVSNRVAWYHSGMLPIFKHVVEKIYEMGMLDAVFCTETFPFKCRTLVMTTINRSSGNKGTILDSFSFSQLLDRVGREEVDKFSNVIYLPSLYYNLDPHYPREFIDDQVFTLERLIVGGNYNNSRLFHPNVQDILESEGKLQHLKEKCKKSYGNFGIDFSIGADRDYERFIQFWDSSSEKGEADPEELKWIKEKSNDQSFISGLMEYHSTGHFVTNIKREVIAQHKKLVNFLTDLGFLSAHGLTRYGKAALSFSGGIDYLPLILIMDGMKNLSPERIIGILSLFVYTEFRFMPENRDLEEDYQELAGEDHYLFLMSKGKMSEAIRKFLITSEKYELPTNINRQVPLSKIVTYWTSSKNRDLPSFSVLNKVHPGILLKSLVRMKSVLFEAMNAAACLGNQELSRKLEAAVKLLGDFDFYTRNRSC